MKKISKYSLLLLISLFVFSCKVSALNYVEVTNVSLKDKSDTTTEVAKSSFDAKTINTNLFFYKAGDYATYKVQIKNISKEPIIIKNVNTPYKGNSGNISYQYTWADQNTTIKPSEVKSMELKVYYSKPINDNMFDSSGDYNALDQVSISFLQGNIDSAQTGDSAPDYIIIGLIALFLIINIIYYYVTKKNQTKFKKTILLLSIILIAISFVLKASFAYEYDSLTINTKFKIKMLPTMASSCSISSPASKALNISDIYEYTPDDTNKYCINITEVTGEDALAYIQSLSSGLTDFTDFFVENGLLNTEKLTKVKILNSKDMPQTYKINDIDYTFIKSTDVSEKQNNTVIMGVYRNSLGGYLILIGGDGGVRAPRNASYLFSGYDYALESDTGVVNKSMNIYYLLDYHDFTNLDTSYSNNMTGMFANNVLGKTFINSSMNTSNVKYMTGMFAHFGKFSKTVNVDINTFDTSKVIDMTAMFEYFASASDNVSLKLNELNTSKVESMDLMFANAAKKTVEIKNFDVSKWNTQNVETMKEMFAQYGTALTTIKLDLSKWNTQNLNNISNMFEEFCQSAGIFSLNLSGWNTSKVTNMHMAFSQAGSMATSFNLDLNKWDTNNVRDMKKMFYKTGSSAINSTYYLNKMTFNDIPDEGSLFTSSTDSMFKGISSSAKVYVKDNTAKTFVKSNSSLKDENIIIQKK